ncbi:protein CNPPD1 [Zeugodacus cucurbitae]|uniref:protein CNPPD1 n=1 Tax=Zeugodacus cucurbitae TaxID=28588 RepID=UPI0023D96D40|nr:protein CNPPD1 [Zeugodacus cucurbitae]
MAFGRSARKRKDNGGSRSTTTKASQVMPHDEYIDRIRKSLYFGDDTLVEEMEMSRPLAEYASELFSAPHKGHSLKRLSNVAAGSVHASPCSLIMALIYLDRLNVTDPMYVLRITPQELFIVSMMISTKFYAGHDEEIYMSDWAEDGHMTEKRLKQLELEFLCAIEWNIYISNEEFFNKLTSIEKHLARREGLQRGWLTYTELRQMLPSFTLVKFILNNIAVMAISYAASVITIAGAFFVASQIPGTSLYRKPVSTVVSDNVIVQQPPPPPIVDYATTQLNAQQRLRRTNKTEITTTSIDLQAADLTSEEIFNATCAALNVEEELLKLECQYRMEAQREAVRQRQHEIESATRLTLPDATQHIVSGNKKSKNAWYTTHFGNWFAHKEEYADGRFGIWLQSLEELRAPLQTDYNPATHERNLYENDFADGKAWNDGNYTSVLWQLLSGTAQKSFVRLPFAWFKFI